MISASIVRKAAELPFAGLCMLSKSVALVMADTDGQI
jgi:hypothetical protein